MYFYNKNIRNIKKSYIFKRVLLIIREKNKVLRSSTYIDNDD
jgi:hypothetical protein